MNATRCSGGATGLYRKLSVLPFCLYATGGPIIDCEDDGLGTDDPRPLRGGFDPDRDHPGRDPQRRLRAGPLDDDWCELGAGDSRRIQRTVAVFLEQGQRAALEYLDALAKEELRCADRAFLEAVRAIVVAAPDDLTRGDEVYQQKGE